MSAITTPGRGRSGWRVVLTITVLISGLALSAGNSDRKPLAYHGGWNVAMQLYARGGHPLSADSAPAYLCQDAAAAWPSNAPVWAPRKNYRNYHEWELGCLDALSYVGSGGQSGLQVPF